MKSSRFRFGLAAMAFLLLAPAGCGDPAEPKAASKLGVSTAPSATPKNRAAFTVQPAIQVQDADGGSFAQAGTVVTAALTSGGGTLGGTTTATTDANGKATFTDLMITGTVGEKVLTFTAPGLTAASATVTLAAGDASAISLNGGNAQSAAAGAAVATVPSVKVADQDGNGVAGVTVTFAVASGGGTVAGASAVSNASGIAQPTSWTLGTTAGANSLTASAAGLAGSPVTFTATATAGAPAALTKVGGDAQTATISTAVATAPSVKLADANGNAIAGATVNFAVASGGGAVTGATQTTNAQGIATIGSWTLGSAAGANTLTASSSGVAAVTFTATGVAASATTTIKFCNTVDLPIWFAYQNGTAGAWTQIARNADNTYSVPITSVGGIAWVTADGSSSFDHAVIYGTKDELAAFPCLFDDGSDGILGTKTINGSVAGLGANQYADIHFGDDYATAYASSPSFSLTEAPTGARDLLASRSTSNGTTSFLPDRFIVRRNLNPASGSTLPVLDFAAAEAVAPETGTYTLSNVLGNWGWQTSMLTANGTGMSLGYAYGTTAGSSLGLTYQGLPASLRATTDVYALFMYTYADMSNTERSIEQYVRSFGNRSATFGPDLPVPTVSTISTSPTARVRVQFASQSQYGGMAYTELADNASNRDAFILVTSGYLGGTPVTWDLAMPDLSSAGFQAIWGFQSAAVEWEIGAANAMPNPAVETPFYFGYRWQPSTPSPAMRAGAGGSKAGAPARRAWRPRK